MGNKEIKENAIFIADSHYPHHGDTFFKLLQKIAAKEIQPPQVFLMGDNFDLLFGYNDYIQTFSYEAIELLQILSKEIEFIYLEGNHDFCLKYLFPNMKVYSRDEQPIYYELNGQRVALSHGDKYVTGFGYDFYCKVLRNKTTLTILKPLQKFIINHRMDKLATKEICFNFIGFEKRVEQILEHYSDAELVIEGHFHQSKTIGKYISLPSLACQGQIGMLEEGKIVFKTL
ncbi:UDP-2,3-diacylglucosamine diphosphatase [Sulfurovum sp. zt1-1]|uniref:UDP-2,3-diacylglucosamine diphosphatase n=1 Tax=Sulfurovum zhangzhouensis TaxID=3019067 RepID=A0ABT7QV74_9BACT|nr:metallophosphoesterase [Sulfurovum zhangzhouensis]MDM5270688.1 UDP-2,3-diacylglucosamine diphosphatase [Sulfurovum zhangzhouensis]